MSTTTAEVEIEEGRGWTSTAVLVLGVTFLVVLALIVIGMLTHPAHHATILHSWNDFYSWVDGSNFAGVFLGLLIPTIPLAVIAEVHHRRTMKKLTFHRQLIKEHHELLKEIRDKLDRDDGATPTMSTPDADDS